MWWTDNLVLAVSILQDNAPCSPKKVKWIASFNPRSHLERMLLVLLVKPAVALSWCSWMAWRVCCVVCVPLRLWVNAWTVVCTIKHLCLPSLGSPCLLSYGKWSARWRFADLHSLTSTKLLSGMLLWWSWSKSLCCNVPAFLTSDLQLRLFSNIMAEEHFSPLFIRLERAHGGLRGVEGLGLWGLRIVAKIDERLGELCIMVKKESSDFA